MPVPSSSCHQLAKNPQQPIPANQKSPKQKATGKLREENHMGSELKHEAKKKKKGEPKTLSPPVNPRCHRPKQRSPRRRRTSTEYPIPLPHRFKSAGVASNLPVHSSSASQGPRPRRRLQPVPPLHCSATRRRSHLSKPPSRRREASRRHRSVLPKAAIEPQPASMRPPVVFCLSSTAPLPSFHAAAAIVAVPHRPPCRTCSRRKKKRKLKMKRRREN